VVETAKNIRVKKSKIRKQIQTRLNAKPDTGKTNQPAMVTTPVMVAHHHLKNGPKMIPKNVSFLFKATSPHLSSTLYLPSPLTWQTNLVRSGDLTSTEIKRNFV
jgi:hypothetical protein